MRQRTTIDYYHTVAIATEMFIKFRGEAELLINFDRAIRTIW